MSNRSHSYPNPDAKHPISARLEKVRAHFDVESKRAFHRRLSDGWGDSVSYEAVRNYHYDREPPPSYLARVAEVFPDIRIEWLVAGKGEMTETAQARRRDPVSGWMDSLRERLPSLSVMATGAQEGFLDLLVRYRQRVEGGFDFVHPQTDYDASRSEIYRLADDLMAVLELPLRAWGFDDLDELRARGDQETYLWAMFAALETAMSEEVHSILEHPGSTLPRVRAVLEGEELGDVEKRKSQIKEELEERREKLDEEGDNFNEPKRPDPDTEEE